MAYPGSPTMQEYTALSEMHNALSASLASPCGSPCRPPPACAPCAPCAPCPPCELACASPLITTFNPVGPMEPVVDTASSHGFQSNCPAQEMEGMVHREVEYLTEAVSVPVQRPIVQEIVHRVREIPTEHIINVRNIPCCNANALVAGEAQCGTICPPPPCPPPCSPCHTPLSTPCYY